MKSEPAADRVGRLDTAGVALLASAAAGVATAISLRRGWNLLLSDSVAHLGMARSLVDHHDASARMLGTIWLPLPHLLLLPFVWRTSWWQSGLAGALPSAMCYVLAVTGFYRLAGLMMPARWAAGAAVLLGLNANLLYLATTAMTETASVATAILEVLAGGYVVAAIGRADTAATRQALPLLGWATFAATLTRYDGWVLGAAMWCMVSVLLLRRRALHASRMRAGQMHADRMRAAYAMYTVLAASGPLLWLLYNRVVWHDWLDFVHGPYSTRAIATRMFPHHYPGWGQPWNATVRFTRTAMVVAAGGRSGWLLLAGAVAGSAVCLWREAAAKTSLLLWYTLPFYAALIYGGSVPIFIPQMAPGGNFDSRYGIELLPALCLFVVYGAWKLSARLHLARFPVNRKLPAAAVPVLFLLLAAGNLIWMMLATPLVLAEGLNQSSEVARAELQLARQMTQVPPGTAILMNQWGWSGSMRALERAGFPLARTIGPEDSRWPEAVAHPARLVSYAIGVDNDPVVRAVRAHAGGFEETATICAVQLRCLHVFRSREFGRQNEGEQDRAPARE